MDELDRLFESLTVARVEAPAICNTYGGMIENLLYTWHSGGRQGTPADLSYLFLHHITSRTAKDVFYVRGKDRHEFEEYSNRTWSRTCRYKYLHRESGPAWISTSLKAEAWALDGKLHRIGGPAVTVKNNKVWMRNGLLHRTDGPAVKIDSASPQYWLDGQQLKPAKYKEIMASRKRRGIVK